MTKEQAERDFLDASIAVWREIDRLMTLGPYPGIPMAADLRISEKLAWERYRAFLDGRESPQAEPTRCGISKCPNQAEFHGYCRHHHSLMYSDGPCNICAKEKHTGLDDGPPNSICMCGRGVKCPIHRSSKVVKKLDAAGVAPLEAGSITGNRPKNKQVPEKTISDECKYCAEGEPEWSPYAKCWIHRRPSLDKRCTRKIIGPCGEMPAGPLEAGEKPLRDPSPEELETAEFKAVWNAIKKWDISRTANGMYSGATGTDVCTILDALNALNEPSSPPAQAAPPLTPYGEALLQRVSDYRSGYSCGYSDASNGTRMQDKDAASRFFNIEGVPDVSEYQLDQGAQAGTARGFAIKTYGQNLDNWPEWYVIAEAYADERVRPVQEAWKAEAEANEFLGNQVAALREANKSLHAELAALRQERDALKAKYERLKAAVEKEPL